MAFTSNENTVAELYIAFFGRAPEQSGLDFWVGELESENKTEAEIRDYFAASTEAQARFDGDTTTEQVEAIYMNANSVGKTKSRRAG